MMKSTNLIYEKEYITITCFKNNTFLNLSIVCSSNYLIEIEKLNRLIR